MEIAKTIDFNNNIIFNENDILFGICEETLYQLNPKFYQSIFCYKMCKIMTSDELVKYNKHNLELSKINKVVIFGLLVNSGSLLLIGNNIGITDLTHFYYYIILVDSLNIDLRSVEKDLLLVGFLKLLKIKYEREWKENKELLNHTNTKNFNKQKFDNNNNINTSLPSEYDLPEKSGEVKKKKYIIDAKIDSEMLTQIQINHLFDMLFTLGLSGIIVKLAKILMISIDNCHLILKMPKLKYVFALNDKLKYYLFYSFRVMYLEEITNYTKTNTNHRFLFNNEEIRNLPIFDFDINNPYIPILVKQMSHLTTHPVEPCFLNGNRNVYDLDNFVKRMDIYSFECLSFLDLSKSAISGSIITACLIQNPLEKYFSNFNQYLMEYYPYDLDLYHILYEEGEIEEINKIEKEINKIEINKEETEVETKKDKEGLVSKNSSKFSKKSKHNNSDQLLKIKRSKIIPQETFGKKIYSDIDIMVETKTMEEFDDIANQHFKVIQNNTAIKLTFEKINTENKYKYIISGLPREIEIFHVNSILGVVAKYHIGAVRAIYTKIGSENNRIYAFPSFITAALTGLHIDMRWTSCNKDLRDIMMKYYQRGFGFLVNTIDRKLLYDYIKNTSQWQTIDDTQIDIQDNYFPLSKYISQYLNPRYFQLGIHHYIKYSSNNMIIPTYHEKLNGYIKSGYGEHEVWNGYLRALNGAFLPHELKYTITLKKKYASRSTNYIRRSMLR